MDQIAEPRTILLFIHSKVLTFDFRFQPIAVETLGPISESACDFLSLLAKKISQKSGDERETVFFISTSVHPGATIQWRVAP